jgi:hypothetical protein
VVTSAPNLAALADTLLAKQLLIGFTDITSQNARLTDAFTKNLLKKVASLSEAMG